MIGALFLTCASVSLVLVQVRATLGNRPDNHNLHNVVFFFEMIMRIAWRLVQASLQPLHTPGIQAFLHLLPTVSGLWMLVEVGPLTKETALGVGPTAGLSALKVSILPGMIGNACCAHMPCTIFTSEEPT